VERRDRVVLGLRFDGRPSDTSVTVVFPTQRTRSLSLLRAAAIFVALMTGGTRSASAQIYNWIDANGSMVISNVPKGVNLGNQSYVVPAAGSNIRAARAVEPTHSRLFDDLIASHASRNGVRADLVRAVIQVESAFNPRALSTKGAMGLMQLMPATARQFGVFNAFDPSENLRGGIAYLRQLLDKYNGSERLALAAYNAGPAAVDRFGQTVPPFRETRDYVTRIRSLAGARLTPAVSSSTTPIFRVVDLIDGREVVRYTDQRPADR
jgi:soluble lytic murein transglycosylase-like protein